MKTIPDLLRRIEAHCRERGMAESTFGRIVVNDGKLVQRLRSGKSITVDTLQRIEGAMAAETAASAPGQAA